MKTEQPNADEIVEAIVACLKKLPERVKGSSDGQWTQQLKTDIAKLGESYRWKICTSGFKEYDGEWLYDLIWYRNGENEFLNEVYLVLESEWGKGYGAIKYDFEKLLLAKSPIKVMIFQAYDREMAEILEKLKRGISSFKYNFDKETYIFAFYNIDTYEFRVVTHPVSGEEKVVTGN